MKVSKRNQCRRTGGEESAPLQTDERDQKSDAHRNAPLQRIGNGVDQSFTNSPERHQKKSNPRDKHRA